MELERALDLVVGPSAAIAYEAASLLIGIWKPWLEQGPARRTGECLETAWSELRKQQVHEGEVMVVGPERL